MKNVKANRVGRPDKALFNVMMGAFFVLFALAPAYWAFYNFGEYRRTTDLINRIEENFKKTSTPEAGQEYSERVTALSSRAKRYGLEMFLSSSGAFVLFGIAGLFFRTSLKSCGKKTIYQPLDPRTIILPNTPIKVRHTIYQNILLGGIIAFLGLLSALNFYQTLISPYSSTQRIVVFGAFSLFVFGIIFALVFLTIRAKRMSVKTIDETGVTRGDGRHFAWTDFCGVVTQTARRRFGGLYVWREELAFANGETAWLIPQRIKNADEVFTYIEKLPPVQTKADV